MLFTGMIYQYDTTQDTGLIMLSDGEKKEFTSNDWIDTVNVPAVGQKISYESNTNGIQIKVASEEDINKALADKDKQSSNEENVSTDIMEHFTNIDDCIKYFTDMGYKLVRGAKSNDLQTTTLRIYTTDEYGEVIIKQSASKISIMQTHNGKQITY